MTGKRLALSVCALTAYCGCVFSQTATGALTAVVTDPAGAFLPGLGVELENRSTGAVVATKTGAQGMFAFNSLAPAAYVLRVIPFPGFKAYTQRDIAVTADETRDLGRIRLELGRRTEDVSVTAVATPVQSASSENSKLIDSDQIMDLTLKGRDLFGLLVTLPGITTTQGDTTNENSIGSVRIDGAQYAGLVNFTVDGITDLDTANNTTLHYEPNMDAIAEMRVLTSNYQAEYGRNSSGLISVVTKSGSREFHGTAWANKRHEMFNANSFFNNLNGVQKSVYRFFVWGYSAGGPAYVPKLFNTRKKSLFFFFSQEYTRQKPATETGYFNTPTAAQRAGNFAGYSDANGVPYTLLDPTTGAPAPNNNLAPLVQDQAAAAYGQAMLNFFPLPNICGSAWNHSGVSSTGCIPDPQAATQQYARNYFYSFNETHPRRNDTLRMDYNVTARLAAWFRYINDYDLDTNGSFGLLNGQGKVAPFAIEHPNPGHGYGVGITYTITPTMVNEFVFGKSYNTWDYYAVDQTQINLPQMGNPPGFDNFATDPLYVNDQKSTRPAGLGKGSLFYQTGVPYVVFGGIAEANEIDFVSNCFGQCPYTNWNDIYSFNDAVSKVWGKHNLKAGLYFERTGKVEVGSGSQGLQLGYYNFGYSPGTPNQTTDGFANAFLGNFTSYNEGGRAVVNSWYTDVEAFLQDEWRVGRRVTLDLGARFTHQVPNRNLNPNSYEFVESAYHPAQAERLYWPECKVNAAKSPCPPADNIAVDPTTGYQTFAALQGTFVPPTVPNGYTTTPTPFPGMQLAAEGSALGPDAWTYKHAVVPAIRLGAAWDVFGDGKTAVRAGFGEFVNLTDSHFAQLLSGNPPDTVSRSVYYSAIDQVPNFVNSAAITPISPYTLGGAQPMSGNYNGSLMVQQDVGFSTVLEAAYVFNLSKHTWAQYQLNAVAPYAEYNVAFNNPNAAYLPANTSGKELNDNYFRPLAGLGNPLYESMSANASYNSLQVMVRRNMTRHLSYGAAYTWSKTMSAGGGYPTPVSPYFSDKARNYGPQYYPAPQALAINYVYEAPNLGEKLNFKLLGAVTDHWMISGITQFRSDIRNAIPGISFTNTTAADPQMNWTGGAETARMLVTGNPSLAPGTASFAGSASPIQLAPGANANGTPGNQLINESAFTIPWPCSATAGATPQQGIGEAMECYGNAGAGSLIPIPGTATNNWDVTFSKAFPLRSERREILFRAEMYNAFNHPQFSNFNITPSYNWQLWQQGVLEQTNANLGRYAAATTGQAPPREMSMSLRFQF